MPVARVVAEALVAVDAVESVAEAVERAVVRTAEDVVAPPRVELVEAGPSLASVVAVEPAVSVVESPPSAAPMRFGQLNIAERNSALTCWHGPPPLLLPLMVVCSRRQVESSYKMNSAGLPSGQVANFLSAYSWKASGSKVPGSGACTVLARMHLPGMTDCVSPEEQPVLALVET